MKTNELQREKRNVNSNWIKRVISLSLSLNGVRMNMNGIDPKRRFRGAGNNRTVDEHFEKNLIKCAIFCDSFR